MKISYNLDKVTKPKFIEPFIKEGFIEYVNDGVIEDVPLDTMVSDYRKNVGRNLATIGSAESTQFISDIPRKIFEINDEKIPFGRSVNVHDIAPLINFLLSNESDFISGVDIPVTGGLIDW